MLFSTKYISNALIVLMSAKVFMKIRVAFYMITIIFEESNKDGKLMRKVAEALTNKEQ